MDVYANVRVYIPGEPPEQPSEQGGGVLIFKVEEWHLHNNKKIPSNCRGEENQELLAVQTDGEIVW